jgi:hypothetical protein
VMVMVKFGVTMMTRESSRSWPESLKLETPASA